MLISKQYDSKQKIKQREIKNNKEKENSHFTIPHSPLFPHLNEIRKKKK